MRRFVIFALLSVLLCCWIITSSTAQIPRAISYQGVLTDGSGIPVPDSSYNITFKIYSVESGGPELWTETQSVQVTRGLFSVILGSIMPLDALAFDVRYWLGVTVEGSSELAPRRELTASAYSMNARSVEDSSVTGAKVASGAVTTIHLADGTVVRSLNSLTDDITLAEGSNVTITQSNDSLIISAAEGPDGNSWNLTGNSGTVPGTNFLGTTDDQPLEIHVNSERVLRLEPDATSPNIIGGHSSNRVTNGAIGATIAGGGRSTSINRITDNYGTISGGLGNMAGDNQGTVDDRMYATVGGGGLNSAQGQFSTVSGGQANRAGGTEATVGGGNSNHADGFASAVLGGLRNETTNTSSYGTIVGGMDNTSAGYAAAIGGGRNNTITVHYATIPGGQNNKAAGEHSFAAGYHAVVDTLHEGTFIFADKSGPWDFVSASANEFAARATGGVRFISAVDGSGVPIAGVELASGGGSWSSISDRNAKSNVAAVDGRDILKRLAAVPITTWNYKSQSPEIRHIGPTSQDFYNTFDVGESDKRINTVDADGVALAAIQGLYQTMQRIVEEKNAQIAELERRIAKLEATFMSGKSGSAGADRSAGGASK